MNTQNLQFQIGELRDHVDTLLRSIENGTMDENCEGGLAVDLGHLLDHINLAWNFRDLTPEELGSVSQSTFEMAMNTVPNFGLNRVLAQNEFYKIENEPNK
jgi:hypothetical protein